MKIEKIEIMDENKKEEEEEPEIKINNLENNINEIQNNNIKNIYKEEIIFTVNES